MAHPWIQDNFSAFHCRAVQHAHELQWDRSKGSLEFYNRLHHRVLLNGHIDACLSSLGLTIELELHQYSLDHRAFFVSLATTRLILSLSHSCLPYISLFSSSKTSKFSLLLKEKAAMAHEEYCGKIWWKYLTALVLNVSPLLDALKVSQHKSCTLYSNGYRLYRQFLRTVIIANSIRC